MTRLTRTLAGLEDALIALERRGVGLKLHATRQDPTTSRLPMYHVYFGSKEYWFTTRDELDQLVSREEQATGAAVKLADDGSGPAKAVAIPTNGHPPTESNGQGGPRLHIVELHEVRSINAGLADLAKFGFDIQSLIPQERTGSQEPRYILRRGENVIPLEDLRGLLPAVRAAGEKGLTITRFKGLGEMNAEELRDTTLDPAHRTLSKVTMDDAGAADDLFRILMGDKVEPRREFIEKHALEVRNLDV